MRANQDNSYNPRGVSGSAIDDEYMLRPLLK